MAQDCFGQLHIRGEHNGLQYRLNGVILPEGLSVFGQALSPRLADSVELITGALPAEYGLRTAGIVDITTKSGDSSNGGEVSRLWRQPRRDRAQLRVWRLVRATSTTSSPAATCANDLGIESPDGSSDPLHDHTEQFQGFAYLRGHPRPEQPRLADPRHVGRAASRFPNVVSGLTASTGGLGLTVAIGADQTIPSDEPEREPARDHPVRRRSATCTRPAASPARSRCSAAIRRLKFTPDRARRPALQRHRADRRQDATWPAACRPRAPIT